MRSLLLLFLGLTLGAATTNATNNDAANNAPPSRIILFFGDSLTAGYGIDNSQAFPALVQQRIDRHNWPFIAVNAGLSGETSAAGLRRIDWLLRRPVDILVLELGANDGLRGIPLAQTRQNLQAIIERTQAKYPQVALVIAGMQIPPNLGPEYTEEFRQIFPNLAQENQAALIPFLLEDVAGIPELNLPDGIHPTPEGHSMLAANVWKVLEPLLQTRLGATGDQATEQETGQIPGQEPPPAKAGTATP
jgi:acyl-CoA thioesterase I